MKTQQPIAVTLGALLLVGALPLAADASEAPEARSHVTENGNTVTVERERIEGENGGRAVRRDVTVSDAEGEVLGQGRNVRYETADGDRGRANARRWTDADGNTRTATRAGRVTEEGDVARRRARTVRDENGEVVRRGVDRAHRDADGGGAAVQRRYRQGENGVAAGRRIARGDGQGNRSVRTQRARRPN
ncbi:MAG: hypothetical protein V2J24_20025 [Pseudomonadales bacterium]|jgi:hypothetical protein|nr:hypothetical protein [Pseudomonadales bacterium]